jgi:exopolysaccharide biosynthesis polyprenyl glycosylphosphotransferase
MALTLAFIEGSSLFLVVCSTIFLWAKPILLDWIDVAIVLGQAFALVVCCITSFYYNDLYNLRIVRNFGEFASRLLQSFGIAFILLAAFYVMFPDTKIAGGPFASSIILIVGLLLPLRAICYGVMRWHLLAERVLILGTCPLAQKIIEEMEAQPHFRQTIVGVADDGAAPSGLASQYPLLGPLEHLSKIIEEVRPDRIVVAMAERRGRLPVSQLLESQIHGIVVEDGGEVYERLTGKVAIESLMSGRLVFSTAFCRSFLTQAASRAVSLAVSLLGLVCLALIIGPIALAIKLDSRGPVFFLHPRVGLRGKCFTVIKFRTMHQVPEEKSEWAQDNWDRITRVGKWVRKFRLDELPQFLNVLRGDMNLVGPRPHPVSNIDLFAKHIPHYGLRSIVRPGMTGWSQIRYGYANNLEEELEKMCYDLYYIKHMSLGLDLRILVDTVKIVLLGNESPAPRPYKPEPSMQSSNI